MAGIISYGSYVPYRRLKRAAIAQVLGTPAGKGERTVASFDEDAVSMAVELHMTRVADVLGMNPWEVRLKNANRIGDTTANRVVMQDPSTVPVTLAAAERVGEQLGQEYVAMTRDRRSGDLLPAHLVAQQAPEGAHVLEDEGGAA